MNLLVLHLSDIHFAKDNAFSEKNVKGIVASLQKAIYGMILMRTWYILLMKLKAY